MVADMVAEDGSSDRENGMVKVTSTTTSTTGSLTM